MLLRNFISSEGSHQALEGLNPLIRPSRTLFKPLRASIRAIRSFWIRQSLHGFVGFGHEAGCGIVREPRDEPEGRPTGP